MIGLLEKSPFAYAYHEIVTDTAGHPVDYRFLEVNAAFEKMTGFPAAAVSGKLVSEFIPGIRNDDFDWVSTYGKVALEGGSVQFEQYSAQLDRWFTVQAYSDSPRFFAAFFFDVTEKHRASSELEGFFSVNLDLLCIADTDGIFIKLNREWEKVLGYREDELTGRSFLDFVHPDDMDNTLAAIQELGEQRPVLNFVNRYRARNGEYRSLEWRSQPRGKRIYAAARDVTDKVLYEERLVVAKEAADEASRVKSDFLANMSHEIRTPMNAIMGLSKLALEDGPSANDGSLQYRDTMRKIYDAARLLLGIINDVLDYSKIEAGRLDLDVHPFALSDTLDQIRDLFSAAVREKGLALLVEIDPSVPALCSGDSLRVAQVLTNLVGNAVKFTERGSVSLSVRPGKGGADRVLFSVSDTGIGIDAEKAGTLFRAFSQGDASTTRKYGGTGLGLVISSRLVAAMGGNLSFSSESGKGSDFFFEIDLPPAEREPFSEDAPGDHAPRNGAVIPSLRGKVVLLAEDNELNIEVGRRFVEKTGARVTIARDGSEAVAIALRGDIDLVLMDIQMPVMDGYEATKRIKVAFPDLPIIALTAGVMEVDRARAKNAGMDGHVAKPIDENDLFAVLAFWLASGDGQSRSASGSEKGEGCTRPVGRLVPESLIGFEARDGDYKTERDEVFRVQILGMFRDQLRNTFSGTANAVRSGNETLAREQVHSLKGIAGIVGARRIAKVANELNALYVDGGEQSNRVRLADELESSIGEALDSLRFLDELPAGLVEYHDDSRASERGDSHAIPAE